MSAFTFHMSNVSTSGPGNNEEFSHLVNHIFTCQLRDENGKMKLKLIYGLVMTLISDLELFAALEKEATKIESYYDVP